MKKFLNSKGVEMANLDGYNEIILLKNVNNNIKHKTEVTFANKENTVFKALKTFTVHSIEAFLKQTQPKVELFQQALTEAIIQNVYDYSNERLEDLAHSYSGKMDQETLQKFSSHISQELENMEKDKDRLKVKIKPRNKSTKSDKDNPM